MDKFGIYLIAIAIYLLFLQGIGQQYKLGRIADNIYQVNLALIGK